MAEAAAEGLVLWFTYRVCGFLGAGPFGQRGYGLDGEVSSSLFSRAWEGATKAPLWQQARAPRK